MWNPPNTEEFNLVVWKITRQIPAGNVSTYGQIASMIAPPDGVSAPDYESFGARWVGKAMNATPSGKGIPWHRVINSKGMISLPPGSSYAEEQRSKLETEGVVFGLKGRVDLNVVGWDGPDETWLHENNLLSPASLRKNPGDAIQPRLF